MRKRQRGEARPSGGAPVGVVVVLVLALVGVGAFALTRDGGAAPGATARFHDPDDTAALDAEVRKRAGRELSSDPVPEALRREVRAEWSAVRRMIGLAKARGLSTEAMEWCVADLIAHRGGFDGGLVAFTDANLDAMITATLDRHR